MTSKYLLGFMLLLSACSSKKNTVDTGAIEDAIELTVHDFKIAEYAYVISNSKTILKRVNKLSDSTFLRSDESFLFSFTAPLFLRYLIKNSIIPENTPLRKYDSIPEKYALTIKDLLTIKANQVPVFQDEEIIRIAMAIFQKEYLLGDFYLFNQRYLHIYSEALEQGNILDNLASLSLYMDAENITGHLRESDHITDLDPAWSTQNTVKFYGWNVLQFQGHTLLWNSRNKPDHTVLTIKAIDKETSLSILYLTNKNDAITLQEDDVLSSPLVQNIIHALYNKDGLRSINFEEPVDKISQQVDEVVNTRYNFLLLKSLIAHAKKFENDGDTKKAQAIYNLYRKKCPTCKDPNYTHEHMLCGFINVPNNFNGTTFFELDQKSNLQIYSIGQVKRNVDFENNLYKYDNIELFIDVFNTKKENLKEEYNHYMYRFNYGYDKISGLGSSTGVTFSHHDQTDSSYVLEVAIPWKTLSGYTAKDGSEIGLSMFIGDSDEQEDKRERVLSSYVNDIAFWNNPQKDGSLILLDAATEKKYKATPSFKTKKQTEVSSEDWDAIDFIPITKVIENSSTKKIDTSYFKTAWNDAALYFLVKVIDRIKNIPDVVTTDRYWIENTETHEVVWKLTGDSTQYFPTILASNTITLPKGKYTLRCVTDDAHSFDGWYSNVPPIVDSYGISVFKYAE